MKQKRHLLLFLCWIGFVPILVFGQVKTWDGGAGTIDWHDSDNWNPNGVPTSFNDVTIRSSSDTVRVNGNAQCNSLILVAGLIVPPNVELQITGTSIDKGIEMLQFSLLENEGSIIIGSAQIASIEIDESKLVNKASGVIEVLSSDNEGINITNSGKLINQSGAVVRIDHCTDNAIHNRDTILNRGNIRIDGADCGIYNEGYFSNSPNGQILVRAVHDGIDNYKDVLNRGSIEIRKFTENGILNDDDDESSFVLFYNSGTIQIDSTGDDGVFNKGYFLNDTTGMLSIENSINMMASNGITSLDSLDNHGSILINNIASNGIYASEDLIYNTGMMSIKNAGQCGLFNEDQSIFRIEETAILKIENCEEPIKTWVGALFNCQGELIIDE